MWDPDGLVAQLRSMPPILTPYAGGGICGNPCVPPPLPPVEEKRKQIYDLLHSFSTASVPALARLLQSGDVNGKRNALLALDVLGGGSYFAGHEPARIDISAALPALVSALGDSDSTVRGWAAESIGYIGAPAVEYVPQLEALLNDPDEGVRNNACLGLRGIGPEARQSLPALRRALSDPSKDVRRFAQFAISAIDIYSSPSKSVNAQASD